MEREVFEEKYAPLHPVFLAVSVHARQVVVSTSRARRLDAVAFGFSASTLLAGVADPLPLRGRG